MATLQPRGTKWRAIVRRKGFKAVTRTFPTKTAAKEWAERMERDLGAQEARGGAREFDKWTVAEAVAWYKRYVKPLKKVSKTQTGNLTRVTERLGHQMASKLSPWDVVEYTRKRRQGEHVSKGHEAISRLFEQGYSIEQVATVTLHKSWNELKRCTQLRPETLHRDEIGERRAATLAKKAA